MLSLSVHERLGRPIRSTYGLPATGAACAAYLRLTLSACGARPLVAPAQSQAIETGGRALLHRLYRCDCLGDANAIVSSGRPAEQSSRARRSSQTAADGRIRASRTRGPRASSPFIGS